MTLIRLSTLLNLYKIRRNLERGKLWAECLSTSCFSCVCIPFGIRNCPGRIQHTAKMAEQRGSGGDGTVHPPQTLNCSISNSVSPVCGLLMHLAGETETRSSCRSLEGGGRKETGHSMFRCLSDKDGGSINRLRAQVSFPC